MTPAKVEAPVKLLRHMMEEELGLPSALAIEEEERMLGFFEELVRADWEHENGQATQEPYDSGIRDAG